MPQPLQERIVSFQSNNTEGLFYSLLTPSTADWLHVPGPVCYKEIHEDGDVGHIMLEHIEGIILFRRLPTRQKNGRTAENSVISL